MKADKCLIKKIKPMGANKSGKFSHLNEEGRPDMVNVQEKQPSVRTATARSIIKLTPEIMTHFQNREIHLAKGPVLQTAIIAGTMAAKKTGDLIPLCHPLGLEDCKFQIDFNNEDEIIISCTAGIYAKTGVEMEALTGASVAALTVYDMCKSMSHEIIIKETRLIAKSGGKSDFHVKE